jgi:hypothetical protein
MTLVILTCGGNDVGYIPRLTLESVPRPLRRLVGVRRRIAEIGDTGNERVEALAGSFDRLLTGVRRQAPRATLVLVDCLTVLPSDEDTAAGPLPAAVASWGRQATERLAAETEAAAGRAGCHLRASSRAGSRSWSSRSRR